MSTHKCKCIRMVVVLGMALADMGLVGTVPVDMALGWGPALGHLVVVVDLED